MNIKQTSVLLSRTAIFVIYFWFGLLKVIGKSPASPLVQSLFNKTLAFLMPFSSFIVLFGLFEMAIGIMFFVPKFEKTATIMFGIHIFTTILPLFMLSGLWTGFLVPTLEGQYIIKNIALVACVLNIWVLTENQRYASNSVLTYN